MLIEQVERMMGTQVDAHLSVPTEESAAASVALKACFDWLREVETVLTRFNPASELCQLNQAAGEWRTVSQLLFDAVEQAMIAARASDGLFDPTLLPLLEKLGYDRDFDSISSSESEEPPHGQNVATETPQAGLWRECELDREGLRIKLPRGAKLDLGGIAKGWAADQALERFFAAFPDVILNVGGDMCVRGEKEPGEPWALGLGDPRDTSETEAPQHAIVLTLRQGGLATSGATTRWWRQGGRRQHHLLDPRTSQPARIWIDPSDDATNDGESDADAEITPLIAAATALAPSAAEAEVAAKVALLRGYPDALQSAASAWDATANSAALYGDSRVALLLILGSGDIVTSSHLPHYLATLGGGGEVWVD
jgi:FAD:protein FMN transferase